MFQSAHDASSRHFSSQIKNFFDIDGTFFSGTMVANSSTCTSIIDSNCWVKARGLQSPSIPLESFENNIIWVRSRRPQKVEKWGMIIYESRSSMKSVILVLSVFVEDNIFNEHLEHRQRGDRKFTTYLEHCLSPRGFLYIISISSNISRSALSLACSNFHVPHLMLRCVNNRASILANSRERIFN